MEIGQFIKLNISCERLILKFVKRGKEDWNCNANALLGSRCRRNCGSPSLTDRTQLS